MSFRSLDSLGSWLKGTVAVHVKTEDTKKAGTICTVMQRFMVFNAELPMFAPPNWSYFMSLEVLEASKQPVLED